MVVFYAPIISEAAFVSLNVLVFTFEKTYKMCIAILSNVTLSPIEILLQVIMNRYLSTSYCLTFVSEEYTNFQIPTSFTNIVTNGTSLDDLVDQMMTVVEMGCSDYIVRIKDSSVFMEAFEKVNHLANARRSNKIIVLLPYKDNENSAKSLLNVLQMKETIFVANLLLVVPAFSNTSGCATYDLVTHKFSGPEAESNQPEYLDKWDSCRNVTIKEESNWFPHNDLSNMYGKTLRLACFTYKPHVLLDLDTSIAPSGRDGTEIRLVEEFCRWINCSIKIVRTDEEQWGGMYENGTGSGVIGRVVEDSADLGITGLFSWYNEYLYMDFSSASIRSTVTCIAPSPRLLVSWDMPLSPFHSNMWIGVVLVLIMSASVLAIAQGTSDKAFLTAFGILIAQSYQDSSFSWRKRRVTGWLIVAALILCNAYGAGLASTFTVPKYEKSIDTIQDILDTGLEWGATHNAWIFSLSLSQEPKIKQLVELLRVCTFEELKEKSVTRSMVFGIEKLPSECFWKGFSAIGEYITEEAVHDLKMMLEDFYYEWIVVMLRKSSPYTQKISALIDRLHESGLLLAWETQVALQHLNYKVQLEVKLSRSQKEVDIVPLSFRHIVGIFYMYVLGIALSTVLFIIELVSKRRMN